MLKVSLELVMWYIVLYIGKAKTGEETTERREQTET